MKRRIHEIKINKDYHLFIEISDSTGGFPLIELIDKRINGGDRVGEFIYEKDK